MTADKEVTKFTPGPWHVDAGTNQVCDANGIIADEIFGGRAEIYRANAKLIAAAPEMYEALRNTTQTLRLMLAGNPNYPKDAVAEVRHEITEAEAVLRKARGEHHV